jgi:hypothetical protein
MKYIIWRIGEYPHPGVVKDPYRVYTLFDSEDYIILENVNKDATDPSSHISICRDGIQIDLLSGDFIDEYKEQRLARREAVQLNGILQVMES